MALTMGYNADDVRRSINSVIAAYDELTRVIGDNVQNNFVNQASDKWACKEARSFFKDFKENMDSLNLAVDNTFESVVKSMNSAAVAWSRATAGVWASIHTFLQAPFAKKHKKISVDSIKENINGTRGIDPSVITIANNAFSNINSGTSSALTKARNAVQNSGFLGGTQAQALLNALTQIQNKINQTVVAINNNAKVQMQASLDKYKSVSQNVSNAFQGK